MISRQLAAQRATITAEVARRGWDAPEIFTDIASGKSLAGREGLDRALALLDSGRAGVLVVADGDLRAVRAGVRPA